MHETEEQSALEVRPVAVFRSALVAAVTKERSAGTRRPDRVQAVAGLSDGDLTAVVQAFDNLLNAPADPSELAERLHAALRALSPDAADSEADDA
jgi:hypothetical protein